MTSFCDNQRLVREEQIMDGRTRVVTKNSVGEIQGPKLNILTRALLATMLWTSKVIDKVTKTNDENVMDTNQFGLRIVVKMHKVELTFWKN